MGAEPDKGAYLYAERIRARLPRRFQEIREAMPLSRYALGKKSGVSRDMIGDVEKDGGSMPTLYVASRLAYAMGMKLWELVKELEE